MKRPPCGSTGDADRQGPAFARSTGDARTPRASEQASQQSECGEAGSVALELVVLAAVVGVLWLFGVFSVRMMLAHGEVDAAARDAARTAATTRSPSLAQAAASASAHTSLATAHNLCQQLEVQTATGAFRPGGTVAVTIRCALRTSDLGLLGVHATTVTASYVAPLNLYEGFDQ